MELIRKQVIHRVDPESQERGTTAGQAPAQELGTQLIPKERYTSDA